jgi:hypothetical protein
MFSIIWKAKHVDSGGLKDEFKSSRFVTIRARRLNKKGAISEDGNLRIESDEKNLEHHSSVAGYYVSLQG